MGILLASCWNFALLFVYPNIEMSSGRNFFEAPLLTSPNIWDRVFSSPTHSSMKHGQTFDIQVANVIQVDNIQNSTNMIIIT